MTSSRSELRIASISDIHLGHPRNPTRDIIENLKLAFPDNAETAQLDLIVLGGDVFDDLLSLPREEVLDIDFWILDLLRLCKKHDILLYVLEGTPSHDWKQSQRFEAINTMAKVGAALKYVTTLSIEYIERFNLNLLFVPDEWESTTEKTLAQVRELMQARDLEQVDYAFMHGQFEYQLPEFVKAQKHSSEAYLALVKHLIFIGHVHRHSSFERIIAQGSFDRLAHGEEEPKGHVRATIHADGTYQVTFVENVGAKIFKTINCNAYGLDETLAVIDAAMQSVPENAFVRIEGHETNPIFSTFEVLVRRYPLITWSKLVHKDDEEEKVVTLDMEDTYVPITITRDNIETLLMERLARHPLADAVLSESRRLLAEVK